MQFIRFFVIWLLLVLMAWFKAHGQVVINEYQCSNLNTVTDYYNQYEDWFELYNGGGSAVDLTGYYLSDKASNPTKWQIPSGSVPAMGFIRVFCNGRGISVGGQLHTSFKLTQTKAEKIVLANPSGTIIDSLTIRLHQPGHSWGRTVDGGSSWGVYTTPTCGSSNGAGSFTRYATKPSYSVAGGFYGGAQNVALSTTEPGATIYYTLDGSVPTISSTVYSTPINVATVTVIKAFVVSPASDVLPSWYEFNTYFIGVSHTLPVVSLSGNQIVNLLNGNSGLKPVTAIEYYDTDQSFKFKTVGTCDKHGNDSWAYDQRGVDYVAWDQYGYNHYMEHKIFPRSDRDEFQRVIFKAGASDNYPFGGGSQQCHMRDAFVHDYAMKVGLNLEGRRVAHCAIYVNGEYWGLYETREKMDDADYTEYYHNQGEFDIDVLKYWGGLQVDYGSDTGWIALYNYMMSPANPMSDPVKYDYVKARLSISNFIDYCIYNTYVVNSDWISWNTEWYRGRNPNGDKKKWNYVMWDMDNVFGLGQNYSGWPGGPTASSDPCALAGNFQNAGPNMGTMDVLGKLLESDVFHEEYILRYADLMNGKLSCDSILEHLDYFETLLTPEMANQTARWGGSVASWQNNVQNMRDFINDRCSFIAGSITGCYDVTGPYTLTVLIDPPGAGTVQVNSFTPPGFPYTGTYFGDITMKLQSFVNPDYVFGYWIPGVTTIAPGILSDTISMMMTSNDTIIAHFKYWPEILGVENSNDMHIAVFPTVTNDQLIIDFRGLSEPIESCRLTNVTGQQLADLSSGLNGLVEGRKVMSLRELGLAPGMYFVEFKSGTHQHVAKVVYQVE